MTFQLLMTVHASKYPDSSLLSLVFETRNALVEYIAMEKWLVLKPYLHIKPISTTITENVK